MHTLFDYVRGHRYIFTAQSIPWHSQHPNSSRLGLRQCWVDFGNIECLQVISCSNGVSPPAKHSCDVITHSIVRVLAFHYPKTDKIIQLSYPLYTQTYLCRSMHASCKNNEINGSLLGYLFPNHCVPQFSHETSYNPTQKDSLIV